MDDDEASGTLPAGFEFGAYVIGACIGQGGMARVYRAEHRALRKPVALKVMDGALLRRANWRRRFLREGQAAAAVKHPNVVDITDVGVWQGRPYLVMEFLEGEDLEQYLGRHKPLSEAELGRLMIPVIAGLATAHASGVVHRDLKPSNVFLARGPDNEIVPKLLDFGISKLTSPLEDVDPSSTPLGELMGSPMYMSPEAVRGARDLTAQSDQYSLGVVLYECVTGRAPFQGDSVLAVLDAVAHGSFDPPRQYRPDLSRTLEGAILRAMSAEPQARFDSVRDVGRALCHSADHRTRLLWMPSFGMPDPLESRTTAVLGTSPLRTVAPLHLPAPAPGRTGSQLSWVGLALLGLGTLGYFGRDLLRPAPAALVPTTVQALQPPAEATAALPTALPPNALPTTLPPSVLPPAALPPAALPPSALPSVGSSPRAPGRHAPADGTSSAPSSTSAGAEVATGQAARRVLERPQPRAARRRVGAAASAVLSGESGLPLSGRVQPTPSEPEASEQVAPARPIRPRAVLGPNRAPILD
ncbi:MAG: serine/threonine-protein kinase [Deltaproteobacteria bacterium]